MMEVDAAAMESSPKANGVSNHVENHINNSNATLSGEGHKAGGDHGSAVVNNNKENKHSSHSSHSSKHKDKDRKHHSSSSKDKDRHKDGSSSSHKHSSSSSSSHKHKDGSSKHSSSSSSKDHKSSSSSSSKDKHGHSSSSSSSKHRDGHSSSSKHKHSSSSSSKHREGSSSGSSDKHREGKPSHKSSSSSDKHRDKERSHSEHKHKSEHRDKSKDGSSSSSVPKTGSTTVKSEPVDVRQEVEPVEQEMGSPKREMVSPKADIISSPVKVQPEKVSPVKVEKMDIDSEDDIPLSARRDSKVRKETSLKQEVYDSDDEPLSARMMKKSKKEKKANKRKLEEDNDFTPKMKKKKKNVKEEDFKRPKVTKTEAVSPTKKGKKKKEQEAETKWKWWEEEKKEDGTKWRTLEHKGPVFADPYELLPADIRFFYDGKEMKLTQDTEEVATFYARMLDHDYTTKEVFNRNFFKDWRKVMSDHEKKIITDLTKCNFKEMHRYFQEQSEMRKNRTKEEKQQLKEKNAAITEEYGFCIIDGHKQKIGNFRIEPPGLFRGRGDHPKQGMHKKRTWPEDVSINCSKDSKVPDPPAGHKWKNVRHDNKVTWLACWNENIQGSTKYVMLNAASKLKGEKDWQKYEIARKLRKCVDKIRQDYREDFKVKEMRVRQRSVAMYFIDKLALRAGNEKDGDEQADTVGCCSLRVEHIKLHEQLDDQEYVVEMDFLGKDSIRYYNKVPVEKRVFKNLQLFMENKQEGDDLFDRLNTAILNKHLQSLMNGLTAKVFRTFNASKTLQEQLNLLTDPDDPVAAKLLSYNRANRAVAVLCNHQRAAPKNFDQQMERMQEKVEAKKEAVAAAKKLVKDAKSDYKNQRTEKCRKMLEQRKKAVDRLLEQLTKLEVQQTDKDENKEIALGTSKLNYLDPRISVAWCKKWDVPIEKVYNKTQREKFAWAIDMVDDDFEF